MPDAGEVTVRQASADEELLVRRVLDGAMLETDAVAGATERGDVLVAVADEQVVGALVLVAFAQVDPPDWLDATAGEPVDGEARMDVDGEARRDVDGEEGMHVDAIAVRRRRRDRGVGRALVAAALERESRLTVAFDPGVSAFYEALEFEILEAESRCWGVREAHGREGDE